MKDTDKKIILDLCGGTGAWSKPYSSRGGYDVRIFTLPHYDVFKIALNEATEIGRAHV